MGYLASTGELGRIVLFRLRMKRVRMRTLRFSVDVFPGFNSEIIGSNPYTMFRETFDIKHLASIIPDDHDLHIPKLATPIDYSNQTSIDDDDGDDSVNDNSDEEQMTVH